MRARKRQGYPSWVRCALRVARRVRLPRRTGAVSELK